MIKYILILGLITSCNFNKGLIKSEKAITTAVAQGENINLEENELSLFIIEVLTIYNKKNTRKFNDLINPEIGLHYLTRLGAYDIWKKKKSICLDNSCKDNIGIPFQYLEILNNQTFDFNDVNPEITSDIIVDCENIYKEGVFIVKNSKTDKLLSEVIKYRIEISKIEQIPFSEKEFNFEMKKAIELEKVSKRIVIAKKGNDFYGNSFVFYVSLIKGRWYVTIIDFISSDCSV